MTQLVTHRRFFAAAVCAAAWWLPQAHVQAFSDLERFPQASTTGGGGGRLFTGSQRDGYACSVCHRGGLEPSVVVAGLPLDGYVPGQTYDVEITWDNAGAAHALHAEIVNSDGRAGGSVSLLDPALVDARGRCGSLPAEDPADYMIEGEGRQILGVSGCGASHLLFRFTAPDLPEVTFVGSVVRSDSSASAEGDGVENLHRVLRRVGEPPPKAVSNCTVRSAGHTASCTPLLGLFGLLGAALARRFTRPR